MCAAFEVRIGPRIIEGDALEETLDFDPAAAGTQGASSNPPPANGLESGGSSASVMGLCLSSPSE